MQTIAHAQIRPGSRFSSDTLLRAAGGRKNYLMEKVDEFSIRNAYFIKQYKADGVTFHDIVRNRRDEFKPISVKVVEDTDRDMKSFGSCEIPFEEYSAGKDAPNSIGDTVYTLIGSLQGAVVEVTVLADEGLVKIMSKHPEIEIDQIIVPENLLS